jgi:hypothetical protein
MKKLLCLSAGIVAMTVFCATAEQAAPPPVPGTEGTAAVKAEAPAKPELKEMTLTGTISQKEITNKKGEAKTMFILTSEDGTIVNLTVKAKGKDGAAIQMADFVGAKAKVVGMGYEKERKGKKTVGLAKITSIEKVADAPAAAPAK